MLRVMSPDPAVIAARIRIPVPSVTTKGAGTAVNSRLSVSTVAGAPAVSPVWICRVPDRLDAEVGWIV